MSGLETVNRMAEAFRREHRDASQALLYTTADSPVRKWVKDALSKPREDGDLLRICEEGMSQFPDCKFMYTLVFAGDAGEDVLTFGAAKDTTK